MIWQAVTKLPRGWFLTNLNVGIDSEKRVAESPFSIESKFLNAALTFHQLGAQPYILAGIDSDLFKNTPNGLELGSLDF